MRLNENKAEFFGKSFGNSVTLIVEKGKDKNEKTGKYDIYNEDKEGTVTLFLDMVKSFESNGKTKYIANIPISMISELVTEREKNEQFKKFFDKCSSNGKIWEIIKLINQGVTESAIDLVAKDLGISKELVNKAYELVKDYSKEHNNKQNV
ncbi:hypothetical protein [Methanococcus voltae]|uniref:hypothetical protein n=1 Tax=Methanococcus voltae TaxID=2188 RepID=UPI001AE942CC|nr:hypothetical protein [Methanococcus voltae]MBP2173312.1 hypothetical protein [Methanococcus voltae]